MCIQSIVELTIFSLFKIAPILYCRYPRTCRGVSSVFVIFSFESVANGLEISLVLSDFEQDLVPFLLLVTFRCLEFLLEMDFNCNQMVCFSFWFRDGFDDGGSFNGLQELFPGGRTATLFVSGDGALLFTLDLRGDARGSWYCGDRCCQLSTVAFVPFSRWVLRAGHDLIRYVVATELFLSHRNLS